VEKINAVIMAARWAWTRWERMKVYPMSRAVALRPFKMALRAGRKAYWVLRAAAG
jgi:hypothetical protein